MEDKEKIIKLIEDKIVDLVWEKAYFKVRGDTNEIIILKKLLKEIKEL